MTIRFMITHLVAQLPVQGERGFELVATFIIDKGDCVIHKYGVRVEIPEGHIGLLLPVPSIVDKIEKVGCLGIITPEDKKKEITAVFTVPDDLVHDFYKVGEVSATLIVIPYLRYEAEWSNW